MTELRQRRDPIRSAKLRNAAKGEQCTLQIFGVCVGGTETTVLAHLHDETFGRGQKADDTSAVFACFGCHDEIDGRTRKTAGEDLTWYKLRALQRTIRRLVERGVMVVPLDPEHLVHDKPVKPRKPPAERAKMQSRPFAEGPSRPIPSRPFSRPPLKRTYAQEHEDQDI